LSHIEQKKSTGTFLEKNGIGGKEEGGTLGPSKWGKKSECPENAKREKGKVRLGVAQREGTGKKKTYVGPTDLGQKGGGPRKKKKRHHIHNEQKRRGNAQKGKGKKAGNSGGKGREKRESGDPRGENPSPGSSGRT